MATYFHGSTSEIPSSADGLQTLYLLNPSYVPYSDTPNMLLLNPNAPANALTLPHAPPHSSEQNLILRSNNPDEISGFHGFPNAAATAPRVHYNLWGSMIDQTTSAAETAAADVSPHMSFRRPNQQGLSLSLSGELGVPGRNQVSGGGDEMRILGNTSSSVSNGISSVILGSKYLKAVQELLDEVVNVGMGIHKDDSTERSTREKMKKANKESTSGIPDGSSGGAELTTAQRQELQMKKSKLVSMLDEVEQRYRQYHHQMQIVTSSFEQAAGMGAAKSYTALALKTISKQFRCLKDAIASQMRATSKNLGEVDCLGAKVEGSRLRYVDHHLRQQRALQQLGMIQHNAWRPQRGLPERAVSILRAWLFEHFLHPYPKDSDKVLLAKQTGLTRSQVSNWFINARVRLWKPMVEEMYLEETKEQERNGSQDNTSRSNERDKELGSTTNAPQIKAFQSKPENQKTSPTEISNSSMSTSPMGMGGYLQPHSGFHPNKPRRSEMHNSPSSMLSVDMEMKPGDTERGMQRNCKDGYPLITGNDGGYGAFSMEDIGRFNVPDELAPRFHGNGVSLTLGLPHSDNLPLSGAQHGFLSHNINLGTNGTEFCAINTPPSHSGTTSYDNIDIQSRKRFAAQLLPDFVA